MQADGNLVLHDATGAARRGEQHPQRRRLAIVQNDGQLSWGGASGQPLWATNTLLSLTQLASADEGAADRNQLWRAKRRLGRLLQNKITICPGASREAPFVQHAFGSLAACFIRRAARGSPCAPKGSSAAQLAERAARCPSFPMDRAAGVGLVSPRCSRRPATALRDGGRIRPPAARRRDRWRARRPRSQNRPSFLEY